MRTGQTAREPIKPHANARVTFILLWRLFEVLNMSKTWQRMLHYLTRNAFTAGRTDKKRMRTDTSGQKILLSVSAIR